MIIELQRLWVPTPEEDLGEDIGTCDICGRELENLSVLAMARTDDGAHIGEACTECVEYLGRRNPEYFPTIEEYRELLARYPEPMFESMAAVEEGALQWPGLKHDPEEIAASASKVWAREVDREGGFQLNCTFPPICEDRENEE
jgi:hypothetical protein